MCETNAVWKGINSERKATLGQFFAALEKGNPLIDGQLAKLWGVA